MKTTQLTAYQIAAAFIGTIVGAGFASGQEVLQFFVFFGVRGIPGALFAAFQFALFGYLALMIAKKIKAKSHLQLIRHISGPTLGYLVDLVITGFLFGGLVTMAAGMGAIFSQEFALPDIWGIGLLLIVTLGTVLFGISGVISAVSYLVPILMLSVIGVSIFSFGTNIDNFVANINWSAAGRAPVPFWFLSAIVYTSYNMVIAVAVLAPLGMLTAPEDQKRGIILGAAGLGFGVISITLAMLANVPAILEVEVPMLLIAGAIGPIFSRLYTLALIAGIFTTAIASLYGFGARVTDPESSSFKWLVSGSCLVAFFLAQFGFSTLVGVLFSAVGYAGLLLLGSFVYYLATSHGITLISTFRQWAFPGVGYRKLLTGEEEQQATSLKEELAAKEKGISKNISKLKLKK